MPDLVTLRANVAMRREDLRIARKHTQEAAARHMTPENRAAYLRQLGWQLSLETALEVATAALIAGCADRSCDSPPEVTTAPAPEVTTAPAPHTCRQCGAAMNPVSWLVNATCGKCCRANHRSVAGERHA